MHMVKNLRAPWRWSTVKAETCRCTNYQTGSDVKQVGVKILRMKRWAPCSCSTAMRSVYYRPMHVSGGNHMKNWGIHVECPIFLCDFKKFGVPGNIFIKVPSIKLHENPSIGYYLGTKRRTGRRDESDRRLSWISANAAKYPDRTMILLPHFKENNINVLRSSCKVPDTLRSLQHFCCSDLFNHVLATCMY